MGIPIDHPAQWSAADYRIFASRGHLHTDRLQCGCGKTGDRRGYGCQVACVPAEAIRVFAERPDIAEALRLGDLADAAILQEWIVNLTRRPAIPRTAHLVLELETRLAMRGNTTRGEFELPLTQAVLGDALGLSSVHLNRTIRRMREDELLIFSWGRMVILDRLQLVRIAEFDARYLTPTAPNKQGNDHFLVSGQ